LKGLRRRCGHERVDMSIVAKFPVQNALHRGSLLGGIFFSGGKKQRTATGGAQTIFNNQILLIERGAFGGTSPFRSRKRKEDWLALEREYCLFSS